MGEDESAHWNGMCRGMLHVFARETRGYVIKEAGIRPNQVTQVRGFADQRFRKKDNPLDASNRRLSLIVQYLDKPMNAADDKAEGAAGKEATTPSTDEEGKERVKESAAEPAKAPEKHE